MANPRVMRKAIERYERCWLPLLTQHSGKAGGAMLAAPLDVAWAWWAHALCPLEYRKVRIYNVYRTYCLLELTPIPPVLLLVIMITSIITKGLTP